MLFMERGCCSFGFGSGRPGALKIGLFTQQYGGMTCAYYVQSRSSLPSQAWPFSLIRRRPLQQAALAAVAQVAPARVVQAVVPVMAAAAVLMTVADMAAAAAVAAAVRLVAVEAGPAEVGQAAGRAVETGRVMIAAAAELTVAVLAQARDRARTTQSVMAEAIRSIASSVLPSSGGVHIKPLTVCRCATGAGSRP